MANSKPSICFDCQNGYAHKCKWVRRLKPIEGWKAEKREYKEVLGTGFTYVVIECPNFKKEIDREKLWRDRKIIELAQNTNLSVREIGSICGVSEHTVWMRIKDLKRKAICILCGDTFIKSGNRKICPKCYRR